MPTNVLAIHPSPTELRAAAESLVPFVAVIGEEIASKKRNEEDEEFYAVISNHSSTALGTLMTVLAVCHIDFA